MFGSNNTKKKETKGSSIMPTSTSHSLNSLVQGTSVEGTVKSESDIRVDGTIKGNLYCNAKVIIGPTGMIEGEVKCKNAVIEGEFQGTLLVEESLHVKDTAKVTGEIAAGKLIVQPGATINGSFDMSGGRPKSSHNSNGNGSIKSKKEAKQIVKSTAEA